MNKIVPLVFAALLLASSIECQKKKNPRGKRPKANCHLGQIEKCAEKMDKYRNDTESYKLITTSRGIDEICSTSQESLNCFKEHITKCATPLQQDLFEFALEQFTKSIDRFCKPGELRNDFLVHSPCIANNVLSKSDYKTKCNIPYMAAVDKTDKISEFDDRLDLMCCAYNRWENCLLDMTSKACTGAGREALYNFMEKAFSGLSDMVCKQAEFTHTNDRCKSLYPPEGTAVSAKTAKNPISKYLTSYFGFLLSK